MIDSPKTDRRPNRVLLTLLSSLVWIASPGLARPSEPATAAQGGCIDARPLEFWQGIAADENRVPEGLDAFALVVELQGYLGCPDPVRRDEIGYGLTAAWIGELSVAQKRVLLEMWTANLGAEARGDSDEGLLRASFSALNLAALVGTEDDAPFLTAESKAGLLGAAVGFLEREHDRRGWTPELGWVHATAHTADLLAALARHGKLSPADGKRILAAIAAEAGDPQLVAFSWGETKRLANVVGALLDAGVLPEAEVARWIDGLRASLRRLDAAGDARFVVWRTTVDLIGSVLLERVVSGGDPGAPVAAAARRALGG